MIYIKYDQSIIPAKLLETARRAQAKLEDLPTKEERIEYIKKKSAVWRAFAKHLSKMSYGKCWYSESPDPQSFPDIDHFRPKAEAKRSENETDDGYPWLAFSWDNFRYALQRSNRVSTHEETGEIVGKGSWFPLLPNSPKASWDDRCEREEKPVLLDPLNKFDVRLLEVKSDGLIGPTILASSPTARHRVKRSCDLYGLNLPGIRSARMRVMRQVGELIELLLEMQEATKDSDTAADRLPIERLTNLIIERTHPKSEYSKAARTRLFELKMGILCVQPEELQD